MASSKRRTGQWTREEEEYSAKIGELFQLGQLPNVPEGMTMRALLASVLNCSPMRVSKKFSGEQAIGKRSYRHLGEVDDSLRSLEEAFHRSVRGIGALTTSLLGTSGLPTPAETAPAPRPRKRQRPNSRPPPPPWNAGGHGPADKRRNHTLPPQNAAEQQHYWWYQDSRRVQPPPNVMQGSGGQHYPPHPYHYAQHQPLPPPPPHYYYPPPPPEYYHYQ